MTSASSIRLLHLLAFLLLQLLALAAGLLSIPVPALAARGFDTATLPILLATQAIAVAMLAGRLFPTPATIVAVVASMVPFAAIAAFDSATAWRPAAAATGLVIVWTLAIASLARGLPGLDRGGLLPAVATLLAAGVPVLRYLTIDAQSHSGAEPAWTLLSPTLAALALQGGSGSAALLAVPSALLAAGLAVLIFRRGRRRSLPDRGSAVTP